MAVAESLTDYKRGDSSKVESLEDSTVRVGETRFQGTIMLLEWDQARRLKSGKEEVKRKERILHLKSNTSYVMVHIGHGIVLRGRRSVP